MDKERIIALANRKFYFGDQGMVIQIQSKIQIFLDALFGKKRILILKANGRKNEILKELDDYCKNKNLHAYNLHGENLKADDVRGKIEVTYVEGIPYSGRKVPPYISGNNQMIIIDNISQNTDIEVLRAFMYMANLGCYYDDIKKLPKDKLPYGSAYVFMAEDNFPLKEFASISSYWSDEAAVLDLRDFQTRVKEHMAEYKVNKLKIIEDGIFMYRGGEHFEKHILPEVKQEFNIIENYRKDFYNSDYSKIKFHKYFYHLNSSQAMCINFFYPLIKEKNMGLILDIIGLPNNIDIKDMGFEKESEIEKDPWRKTNFDFYIELISGLKVYFEIKYTENEFGKAEHDAEHKDKFNKVYKPLLEKNQAIIGAFKTEEYFLDNYQIMRNIVHISKDSYVVFLYPENNYGIRKQALNTRKEVIEDKFINYFILYTWEDIAEKLIYRLPSGDLKNYYIKEFTNKYLNI